VPWPHLSEGCAVKVGLLEVVGKAAGGGGVAGRVRNPAAKADHKRATHPQGFIHELPPGRVTLRGRKSRPGYPKDLRALGEHLRRARLDRGLLQRQVAAAIGCHHD